MTDERPGGFGPIIQKAQNIGNGDAPEEATQPEEVHSATTETAPMKSEEA